MPSLSLPSFSFRATGHPPTRLTGKPTEYILCSMKTVISVKVDPEVKKSAQEVAKSAGISLSTLVNAFLRQVAATRRIELYAPEPMTPKLEKLIAEVEAERNAGQASEPFSDVEEFLRDLKR
jgi:addiction module RelB/DinJ family antitoxin